MLFDIFLQTEHVFGTTIYEKYVFGLKLVNMLHVKTTLPYTKRQRFVMLSNAKHLRIDFTATLNLTSEILRCAQNDTYFSFPTKIGGLQCKPPINEITSCTRIPVRKG